MTRQQHWQLRNKQPDQYCDGMNFDTSQMDELEFERLLLWSGRFPKWFTQSHDEQLTEEVYRRAKQVRNRTKRAEDRVPEYSLPMVRVSELGDGQ